jgi:hypothetical protein
MPPQRQRGFPGGGREGDVSPLPEGADAPRYPPFRNLTRLRLDHRDAQSIGFGQPVVLR